LIVVAVLALSALTSRLALAAPDELIPCKKLSVNLKRIPNEVKFICKAPKGVSFALPQFTSDPATNGFGMSLLIRDLGSDLYIVPGAHVPSSGWTGIGDPAGSRGFRYRNTAYDAPCRVVVVTRKQVTGTCKVSMGPASLPVVGDVGMTLFFGGNPADTVTYCAQLGGTTVRNDATSFLRKNSPAPGSCPPFP
jgi:hypothetical protein